MIDGSRLLHGDYAGLPDLFRILVQQHMGNLFSIIHIVFPTHSIDRL